MNADQISIDEPTARAHFDAFSEPRTIPSGWNVDAFAGKVSEPVNQYSPATTVAPTTGDLNAAFEEPQNPVS